MGRKADPERDQAIVAYRSEGMTYEAIAALVGMSPTGVQQAWDRIMETHISETVEQARKHDLERIDWAMGFARQDVMNGKARGIENWCRLLDHRAKLLGLYAPQKQEVTVTNATDDDSLRFWLDQWTTTPTGEGTDSGSGPEMVASSDGAGETGTTTTGGQLE